MDEYDDTAREQDLCLGCDDSIEWVSYMGLWMSITKQENCGVCPSAAVLDGLHEPSYSV